jgi:arylsulfatase A-like enzyme
LDEDCDGGDLDDAIVERALDSTVHPIPDEVAEKPPIIYITICGFSARRLKMLGGKNDPMPFVNKLAKQSVIFENAFSQGPSTRLGLPAMHTSRWDTEIKRGLKGKHPYPLHGSNYTMAELFRDNGYETRAVVPIKYFRKSRWKGLHQGFRSFDSSPSKFFNRKKRPHNAHKVTDAAIKGLSDLGDDPLFMWVHFHDAHSPHRKPKGVKTRSKKKVDIYEAELTYIDRQIKRLYDVVNKKFEGRAWIVITGDHGVGFDKVRHSKKGYGYDLNTVTLHVPILFHAPFLRPHKVKGLATTMDILPTLSNLLRFKTKRVFRGVSLVPELLGRDVQRPQLLFHTFFTQENRWKKKDPLRMIGVRTPTYNLVVDRVEGRVHLWNWSADYLEEDDLLHSRRPEDQAALRRLKDLGAAFLYRFGKLKSSPKKKKKKKPKKRPKKRRKKDDKKDEAVGKDKAPSKAAKSTRKAVRSTRAKNRKIPRTALPRSKSKKQQKKAAP